MFHNDSTVISYICIDKKFIIHTILPALSSLQNVFFTLFIMLVRQQPKFQNNNWYYAPDWIVNSTPQGFGNDTVLKTELFKSNRNDVENIDKIIVSPSRWEPSEEDTLYLNNDDNWKQPNN